MSDWRQKLDQDEHDYRVQMRANLELERRDEEELREPESAFVVSLEEEAGSSSYWPIAVFVGLAVLIVLWELYLR